MAADCANTRGLRVGAVSYLNSKPLVFGIEQALADAEIRFDLPSRLADDLAHARLDLALVPIVEYFRQPDFRLISNACVGCRGPVLSVKLFFRTPPAKVRRLALDEGSRTSAALSRILLAEQYGAKPQIMQLPIGDQLGDTDADAVLLIGDRAMRQVDGDCCEVWDLGDRWCRWTELPFVFAAWVARSDLPVDPADLAATLESVRDQGVSHIGTIANSEAEKLGLAMATAREYLQRNLHFTLGPGEQLGMQAFAQRCLDMQMIRGPLPPLTCHTAYDDCSTH